MPPVSAVLITKDEEENLPAALGSVRFCDEIVVLDAGSSDRTREVAWKAGARVEVGAPWPGFLEQRRRATALARNDWVLALDADERVTPALAEEVRALARDGGLDGHAGWSMPRVAFYLGRWIRGTDWGRDRPLRLFDRRRGGWEGGLVHESVKVEGPVGRLRHDLQHFPYANVGEHLETIDRYTTLWAVQAHAAGRRAGPLEPALAGGWAFLRNFLLRGGVLLGEAGLTVSLLNAHYVFVKLVKLRERQRAEGRPAGA